MEGKENSISSLVVKAMRILNFTPLVLNLRSTAAIRLYRIELGFSFTGQKSG
jgi:hypothetical protein